MTDPTSFTVADNWHGGFYELAIELGGTNDDRLGRALTALWQAAAIRGCYGTREREPHEMPTASCTVESVEKFGHLLGLVTLPGGTEMVCGVVAVREPNGSDWLDFYLPTGALERADDRVGAYPFDDDDTSLQWRGPIDDWLAGVAAVVYSAVDFRLGLIGFEVSGFTYAHELSGDPVPPRHIGYLIPDGKDLRYLRATN